MMENCPDCRYAREERAGIHMTHAGLDVARADALAASERCAAHSGQEAGDRRQGAELRITVKRWEKFGENTGEYVGGKRTLAGPYRFGFDGTRAEVVEKYRRWLHGEIRARGMVFGKLRDLLPQARSGSGLVLVCADAEIGEVIARALRYLNERDVNDCAA